MRARRPTHICGLVQTGRRGRRPLRSSIGKRCVGVGLPDDPNRFSTTPTGRARGPCPTKILCAIPGGQSRPPLQIENRCHRADVGIGPYKVMPCRAGPMCPAAPWFHAPVGATLAVARNLRGNGASVAHRRASRFPAPMRSVPPSIPAPAKKYSPPP